MGNSATRKKAAYFRQKQIRAKVPCLIQPGNACPRFIADVMLGRLAKWLRIAGFDVLYSNKYTDNELVEISNREGRVLLSRDTRLLVRKSVKEFIFLESQNVQVQIKQVFNAMHVFDLSLSLTRCLSCNEALVETARVSVREKVPPFVYKTQSRFKSCPKCGKIFWAGTHRNAVIQTLEKLVHETENNK
jgi:uncharacterized protein with PIN domain